MAKLFKAGFKRLFQVFIFLLPVQLGYHFWPDWAFVFGIRVDYLSPVIYLTDAVFLLILFFFLAVKKGERRTFVGGLLGIGVLALINIAFSSNPEPAVFKWVKIFELFCLAVVVIKTKELKVGDWIAKPLGLSMVMVAAVGIAQVVKGGSLGGPLYFLGERSFKLSTPGIALASFAGRQTLRAYSIFSHPNSLAGFLGAGAILVLSTLLKKKNRLLQSAFLASTAAALFFAFSFSAAFSLIFVAALFLLFGRGPKLFSRAAQVSLLVVVTLSLLSPLSASRYADKAAAWGESYTKRLELAAVAGKMFSQKPLLGEGLNNFVKELPEKSDGRPVSWWLQPVHNIFLLTLAETGLMGFLFLFFLFFLALKKAASAEKKYLVAVIVFVLITGFFDHYWLTLQQNQILLSIIFGLSFRNG